MLYFAKKPIKNINIEDEIKSMKEFQKQIMKKQQKKAEKREEL